jgi:phage baseplate assembly protein W
MNRTDYAFPFRIDPVSGQAAQSPYARHVDEMIRQVLLTTPGERADLPEFGCGLRQLLFAPNSDALQATTQLLVRQSLSRWLGNQISLINVSVTPGPGGPPTPIPSAPPPLPDYSQIVVLIEYLLVETQSTQQTQILVS